MAKINCQNIGTHMSYTIKELAECLKVNQKTCSRWIEKGMKTVPGGKKPIYIMGHDAKDFLMKKKSEKKVKLKRNEFYCFTCRVSRTAKRGSNKKLKGRKTGICSVCKGKISRTI